MNNIHIKCSHADVYSSFKKNIAISKIHGTSQMSKMTAAVEQWTVYSAAQNLPAVLNDPNKGKQSNFFVRTWGDGFVEKTDIGKSPFLPDINFSHFESYLRKHGRRYKKHTKCQQTKLDLNTKLQRQKSESTCDVNSIPEIFLKPTLPLNDAGTFNAVFPCVNIEQNSNNYNSGRLQQEKLSHYLDSVEVQIARQVSQKSSAFFHAMTSHDTIMEQMGGACENVKKLRSSVQSLDSMLSKNPLKLLGLVRSRNNHINVLDKLRLMSTVLQTQPTLQLLLSSSDYVAALELISSTQEVLSRELAGVTSLRHLPSQLKEMSRLIDKMLNSEFERYAASDLNRPLDSNGIVEPDRLTSIIAGLLRQKNLQFLEVYKKEAVTSAQAILKQITIEQIADNENDLRLTGSGDANSVGSTLDSTQWLQLINVSVDALSKLALRVKDVHDIIQETSDISAGKKSNIVDPDTFLTPDDYNRVEIKLKDLLTTVCDYYHDRIAKMILDVSSNKQITKNEVSELHNITENFSTLCKDLCGRKSTALTIAFNTQASKYVQHFHTQRKDKLILLLDAERWKSAEIPVGFQTLVDQLVSENSLRDTPSSPSKNDELVQFLEVGNQQFIAIGAVIMLLRLISEYCVCVRDIPSQALTIGRFLAELLKTFNSRICQLVLGANALKTAGLKTITTTNLALASRALQLVLCLIPHVKRHFKNDVSEDIPGLDLVERDIGHHIQELKAKILNIMNILLSEQLNDWTARPPVPSNAFRNISRHLVKLHEAVNKVLPPEQVIIYFILPPFKNDCPFW